ncbi:DNA-directed RNA polymerase II subunit RPB1-like isoform X1 [Daphnia pulex]|uniref:DNA-directed RNA polymerase II subunit RPB1-like isoform X1 n=1 Tax=Daphnia pulex TaxID=6669 RepID=UPI001EDF0191|nr:DNA-directed RNA polymerase II subunit RPB1-like isoform X1 [Daphnia pulex]
MKFIILAALFAVAAADSYRSAEYAPKYEAPAYKSTYEAKYETPQPYDFSWAVNDYYNDYSHSESSDGKVTTGSYRVVLPDGRTQIVTYKADSYGYVADVKYTGEAKYPEYVANNYKATTYSAPAYKPTAPTYTAPTYTAPVKNGPTYTVTAPTYSAQAPAYTATPVYKAPAVQPQY